MRGLVASVAFILAAILPACVPQVGGVGDAVTVGCAPAGYDRAKLEALKAAQFEIADDAARQTFAREIVECLGSPDPKLRDGVAFEALSHMARAQQLKAETMKAVMGDLYDMMESRDSYGFAAPFAALAMSEMARADRIEPYLSDGELATLLLRAQRFEVDVSDYRGFDDKEGWRHAVAHGADLLMQLAMNPRLERSGLEVIRGAVAAQVAPAGHAYVFGESARLARPIWLMAQRDKFSEAEWTAWLESVAGPSDFGSWEKALESEAGLARLHDVKGFVLALWADVTTDEDAHDDVLKPGLLAAMKELP